MTIVRIAILAVAALLAPAAATAQEQQQQQQQQQQQDIVVHAETARAEIERILNADNLDTAQFSPREVVEIMSGIERGRAPEDFWNAYQLHVRAWANLAEAADSAQGQQDGSASAFGLDGLERAETAVGTTFDEVERIARSYHAHLPAPRVDTRTIA